MDAGGSSSGGGAGEGDLYKIPEGCISHILSLTSPRDACRSAATSSAFRLAYDSDTVWERFLPPDHQSILDQAVNPVGRFATRKELYFHLCRPVLIDGGRMSFSLEKESGKKCYMLSARKLMIVWSTTPAYWEWISFPDSRFTEVALLKNVCWLEIHGKIASRALSSKTTYGAFLVFKLTDRSDGLNLTPQQTSVRMGGQLDERHVQLQPIEPPRRARRQPPWARRMMGMLFTFPPEVEHQNNPVGATDPRSSTPEVERGNATAGAIGPQRRTDGWMEVELGQFFNDCGDDGDVDMYFMEVHGGHWKTGLIIEGIEVRPK